MKKILMLGTFDSKGKEFEYLYEEIRRRGFEVTAMNCGVYEPKGDFPIDISAEETARAGGCSLEELRRKADRGTAMRVMCRGAKELALSLWRGNCIAGVVSMGGGGGTSIACTAMQALPLGFPKVCVTTLACGDTREYVGTRDIVLFPSIVDICGLNRFSRTIISRAAGAVCGMAELEPVFQELDAPVVCISMFGNSTPCVEKCAKLLEEAGFAPVIFHATGGGGKSMEEFIREKNCVACLDITTTEWADELCGGILSAGPGRLDGPGIAGIPHVIAPGCLDMVNFGSGPTVPEKYKNGRILYEWNPMVTLMRTNREENQRLGEILAEKANASDVPVAVIFPLKGVSILDGEGQPFCDWETDRVLLETLREKLKPEIPVVTVEANLNEDLFAKEAVKLMQKLLKTWKG